MTKVVDVEGIGPVYAKKLTDAGISTVEGLLETGGTPKGRKTIAEKSGITETLILEWVNRADLARIKGVGSEYADLLEASGVDTVVELGKRVPANLFKKMEEVNAAKKLVRKLPTESQVSDWVEQAKHLERKVTY
jgi:predicted flap endonuclease-1-like 5' DNA nuclease